MADTNNVGYIDPSIPNPGHSYDSRIIIYGYTPSASLSLLALILYALFLVLYILRLFRPPRLQLPGRVAVGGVGGGRKVSTGAFTILTVFTIVFEIVGYAFRIQSASPRSFVGDGADPYKTINFILQYFFIVVAPVFLSGGVYTLLASLMLLSPSNTTTPTAAKLCGLPRRAIIAIFVTADVACTIVQVAGAALIGVRESRRQSPTSANRILLAGLVVQVGSFSGYIVLLGVFLRRCRGFSLGLSTRSSGGAKDARARGGVERVRILLGRMMGVRTWVVGLVLASLLVYLRTIFRMAETSQGVGGYASSHEVFFGVLEFMPIVLAVGILGFVVPGIVVEEERVRGDGDVEDERIEDRVVGKEER